MKKCPTCKIEKDVKEFYKHSIAKDGLRSRCKKCQAAYSKQYREEHKEETAAYQKQYNEEHKEEKAVSGKQWRENNPSYNKQYNEEHKEEIAVSKKQYREEHKEERAEYHKQYKKDNPDKCNTNNQNRRARKNGNGGVYTAQEWAELKERYDYTCLACNRREPDIKLTADHIMPLIKGGRNSIDNIQPLCKSCNCSKQDKTTDYRNCFNGSKFKSQGNRII